MNMIKPNILKFSVKNFLADLPNMLNKNFEAILSTIASVFDYDNNMLKAQAIETNTAKMVTLNVNNINVIMQDGTVVSIAELIHRVHELESKIN